MTQAVRALLGAGECMPGSLALFNGDEALNAPACEAERAALREAAWAMSAARRTLGQPTWASAGDEHAAWKALVAGLWSLVDRFDREGRRLLVARPTGLVQRGSDALTRRDAEVAAFASRGLAYKLIARELGLATSTVAWHLARALRKLGFSSRRELVQCAASAGAAPRARAAGEGALPPASAELGPPAGCESTHLLLGDRLFLVLTFPLLEYRYPSALSVAERAIVVAILEGKTNAEIARERSRSPHTIANQTASAFRKLGVRSRVELAARCARRHKRDERA